MKNIELAHLFAEGAERGRSSRMSIEGDRLYSYSACIAIRDEDKFILSNRTAYLGGGMCSKSTSTHIGYAYEMCEKVNPITLVDGWAERGSPEWFIPPPYKTIRGIIKGFASGVHSGWVGNWCRKTRTKQIKFEIKGNELYSGNELIVIREYITSENRICEACPKRFVCLTERPMFNKTYQCPRYLFYIVEKTEHKKLTEKLLQPHKLVQNGI